jgi:hypothetical protein
LKPHIAKTARTLVALCLVALGESLAPASDAPPPALPIVSSSSPERMEIKLLVPADKVTQATKILELDSRPSVKQIICFFDTTDGALEARGLILRARQKTGSPGDSTVKLRTTGDTGELSKLEQSIKPEADWTRETDPSTSRSVDNPALPDGLVRKVAQGGAGAKKLFNKEQRRLVEARIKDFNWGGLRCYGPIQAEVWEQSFKLKIFPDAVTVERWHMTKETRTLDILEVSAKARVQTAAEGKELVKQFFKATEEAGLGSPGGRSKTQIVLDFFKPGRHPAFESSSPDGN